MSKVHMFLYFSKSSFFNCSCFLSVSSFWSCSSLLCSTPGSLRICIKNIVNYFKHHTNSLGGGDKAIPWQAWTGPEGCRRLRLPDFKTLDTWMFGNMHNKLGEKPAHQHSITAINKFCTCVTDRHHHTRHG